MRTALASTELLQPRSLREALQMLRDEGPLIVIAGCTDVFVSLNFGTLKSRRFLNVWPLHTMRGIFVRNDRLVVGALATYTDIIRSPLVGRRLPMLAAASREIGGVQIQNRGTLAGNVANASPAGDSLPVLAAADAIVVLRSRDAERRVPLREFYTGYRQTVMRPDELIVAIEVPPVSGRQWFRKVGTRAAQAIAKVTIAGVRGDTTRVAYGSVAPTVVRVPRTEAELSNGGSIDAACELLKSEISPIDDLRSTADYRRRVAENLLRQFVAETQSPGARNSRN